MLLTVPSTSRIDGDPWQDRAACRDSLIDMAPEDPALIPLAKKVCERCLVRQECLVDALDLAVQLGPGETAGIWGGLTQQERSTLHGLGVDPRECPGCGAWCVPINFNTGLCSVCKPAAVTRYEDYRAQITDLIRLGLDCQQVATRLQLRSKDAIASACRRWGLPVPRTVHQDRRVVHACGTLPAKERHRRHGESWEECACKHVRWPKRKSRPAEE